MTAPAIVPSPGRTHDVWERRARRAAQLADRHAYARDTFALYARLLAVQQPAHAEACASHVAREGIADHVVARVAAAVVAGVESAGIPLLAAAAGPWLRDAAHDVACWLAGDDLPCLGAFFARASAAPVLEAVVGARELLQSGANDARRCPRCGGSPQLAFTAAGGDGLVTSPLQLSCARCGGAWRGARLRCAACGEADTTKLESFAAGDELPHLRVDACHSCRRYLVHVDLRRDPDAVPEVDELLALPLDLHARQQGFEKIVTNQMGI